MADLTERPGPGGDPLQLICNPRWDQRREYRVDTYSSTSSRNATASSS